MTRRRDIIALALLAATPLAAFHLWDARWRGAGADFDFSPIAGAPGFRRVTAGAATSPLTDPFAGLALPGETPPAPLDRAALCEVLFGGGPGTPGTVPVASFSDYFCPYCRDLTLRLAERAGEGGIAVTWHELPILGPASDAAARAALAADAQGLYPEFQARLLRSSFRPDPAYLTELARSFGADPDRLLADMDGPEIGDRLTASARAARTLGIGATPALVVGRTLVPGAIPAARLDALIDIERKRGATAC